MSEPRFAYGSRSHAHPAPGWPALELKGVSVSYERLDTLPLCCVDLTVAAGSRIALLGPNGSGKSTLLKAVAGILPARSGTISIYGQPVGACHHRVAYLPQRSEIDWTFPITVERLVLTGRYVHLGWLRRPGRDDRRFASEALERLGLARLCCCQIGRLSGGQQQRVLLARALAQESDLLLLDEPLNAVDARTQRVVMGILDELQTMGKTAIVSTHGLGRLEAHFDDSLWLGGGRVVAREAAWTG